MTSDPSTSLALSSRNAYLTSRERELVAPALYAALQAAKQAWLENQSKAQCVQRAGEIIETTRRKYAKETSSGGSDEGNIRLDYISMNDPDTFEVLPDAISKADWEGSGDAGRPVILSGAMWVGRTRLIDNIVLGDAKKLGILDQ